MSWLKNVWILRDIILPALDVAILAFLLYRSYQILVQTKAIQLVRGVVLIALLYAVAFFLNLSTLRWILNFLAPGLVIGIAIIFQPELRKIFTRIGQSRWFNLSHSAQSYDLDAVLNAAEILAGQRRGGLIVIARSMGLKNFIDSGTRLDADISSSLILTIFGHDTPLHDGALIIEQGKIAAAGCFLPLSEQPDIRRSFGTRHRAALGVAEETDAVVVVVSEERGSISLVVDGVLHYDLSVGELGRRLRELYNVRVSSYEEEIEERIVED